MKHFILFAALVAVAYAAKVPLEPVPVPVTVAAPINKDKVIPQVPQHVQHVVEQAHQHIPQVINHHLGVNKVKDAVPVATTGVPHHIHVDITHQHSDGHKHIAHNVPHNKLQVPQSVVDRVKKVEQHIQHVMNQAHQHIPQVINQHIAQQQKNKDQHAAGHVTPVPGVVKIPEVTVKTTTM